MKTIVKEFEGNTKGLHVYFDDVMSEYIIESDELVDDVYAVIQDINFLDDEGQVDYDKLYTHINSLIAEY